MLLKRMVLIWLVNQEGKSVGILTGDSVNLQANVVTSIPKISVTVTEAFKNVIKEIVPIDILNFANGSNVVKDASEKIVLIFILRKKKILLANSNV